MLLGLVLGLAIYNRVLLDFPLPLALYKKLLQQARRRYRVWGEQIEGLGCGSWALPCRWPVQEAAAAGAPLGFVVLGLGMGSTLMCDSRGRSRLPAPAPPGPRAR